MEGISGHSGRTRLRLITFALALAALLGAAPAGCQTSLTPPPKCKPGWHVEHAPSHQGHVWDCVADYGPGRVPG